MNIDKIKWMVERAEGFEFTTDNFISVMSSDALWSVETLLNDEILFPHLLTRTIEGINRHWLEGGIYHIVQGKSYVSIYTLGSSDIQKFSTIDIDEAKTAAIDYVWEQEVYNVG